MAGKNIFIGPSLPIKVVNRKTGNIEYEQVFGDMAMRIFYGSTLGFAFTTRVLTKKFASVMYGWYNDSRLSCLAIRKFIKQYNIDMSECAEDKFSSFNHFFARKLKKEARPLPTEKNAIASPGDGRILVFPQIEGDTIVPVKWAVLSLWELFGKNAELCKRYHGGTCAILRLCPVDYHRFHFPVSGFAKDTKVISGIYHSVSPYALEKGIPVHCLNVRTFCELETEHHGTVLLMEIGALMVGSIVQTYKPHTWVQQGDEKGYFKFGGSTVMMFFEKGVMNFSQDLVEYSQQGLETLVKMGEKVGEFVDR